MIVTVHLTDKTKTNGDIPGGNITEVRKWLNSSNKFISKKFYIETYKKMKARW